MVSNPISQHIYLSNVYSVYEWHFSHSWRGYCHCVKGSVFRKTLTDLPEMEDMIGKSLRDLPLGYLAQYLVWQGLLEVPMPYCPSPSLVLASHVSFSPENKKISTGYKNNRIRNPDILDLATTNLLSIAQSIIQSKTDQGLTGMQRTILGMRLQYFLTAVDYLMEISPLCLVPRHLHASLNWWCTMERTA